MMEQDDDDVVDENVYLPDTQTAGQEITGIKIMVPSTTGQQVTTETYKTGDIFLITNAVAPLTWENTPLCTRVSGQKLLSLPGFRHRL